MSNVKVASVIKHDQSSLFPSTIYVVVILFSNLNYRSPCYLHVVILYDSFFINLIHLFFSHSFFGVDTFAMLYIHRHVLRPSQDSSVWLGLTSREQLMSPEYSKHQVLNFAKMLVVNGQKIFLFSSVFSRVLNEYIYIYIYIYMYIRICPYSCIQPECGKMRTRITPNTDTFYAVYSNIIIRFSFKNF